LTPEQKDMQNYLKKLLNWRKNNPVIANGKTLHFAPFNSTYVYFRYDKEQTVMVVMNKNDQEITLPTKRFAEVIKGRTKAVEVLSGGEQNISMEIKVPARSAIIYEIQ
jgi:hypothetical protein